MLRSLLVIVALLPPSVAVAQDAKKAPDHGRVLSCAIDVFPHKLKDTTNLADTKNYVFRGKVISLGKDRTVSICYDTEHLRVAGAWVGKPMTFAADKNMGPSVEGTMLFATKPGPGWAKDGKWDDPRVGKEGPLPRDWAHYKGLYVHGDKVVLSYTVGDMDVLEMPEVIGADGPRVIQRTFTLSSSKKPVKMLVLEETDAFKADLLNPVIGPGGGILSAESGKWIIGVALFGPGELEVDKQRLYWKIRALPFGGNAQLVIYKVELPIERPFNANAKIKTNTPELKQLIKGGPPRWSESLEATITRGDDKSGPYVLDQIQLPETNPWNASIRFAGLDFFPDGRAALCTWDGDVWIVSGLGDKLGKVRWKRFASGLQAPLGLKIINGHIYTAGRDQITKLHDLNGDGEADFYENFNNDPGLTLQRHEFVMDLQTDKDGNWYYCRSGHYVQSKRGDNCCVYKLSPDGRILEKFATGFREPNGMSIGPDGSMTVADNEGNGIPQTPIYLLKRGGNYGFKPSLSGKVNEGSWKEIEKPMVWLGPKVDGSAGGQVWVPGRAGSVSDRSWGPLSGQLLHTSYGNCALFSVLIDKQAEPWQAAVWKFPLQFNSGIMRARFNPVDGQLYLCGLRGWGTSAVKDGQFCRVRFTGQETPIPVGYRIVKNGIEIAFSHALDKTAAEDDDNWAGRWSGVLKKVLTAKEQQEMPITSVRLSGDRKTVTVAVEKLRAAPNFAIQYRLKAADGASVHGELNGTIHRIP